MSRFPITAIALALAVGGVVVACSGSDGGPPTDPGGINGPARVDPDAKVNVSGGSTDD